MSLGRRQKYGWSPWMVWVVSCIGWLLYPEGSWLVQVMHLDRWEWHSPVPLMSSTDVIWMHQSYSLSSLMEATLLYSGFSLTRTQICEHFNDLSASLCYMSVEGSFMQSNRLCSLDWIEILNFAGSIQVMSVDCESRDKAATPCPEVLQGIHVVGGGKALCTTSWFYRSAACQISADCSIHPSWFLMHAPLMSGSFYSWSTLCFNNGWISLLTAS